jgi:hypothetical protein
LLSFELISAGPAAMSISLLISTILNLER